MREDKSYSDLAHLFASEDAALDAGPFVARVAAGVARRRRIRRLTLTSIGVAGAVIAGLQLPGLVSEWAGIDRTINEMLALAHTQIVQAAADDPFWLAVIIGAAFCALAVSSLERA